MLVVVFKSEQAYVGCDVGDQDEEEGTNSPHARRDDVCKETADGVAGPYHEEAEHEQHGDESSTSVHVQLPTSRAERWVRMARPSGENKYTLSHALRVGVTQSRIAT